MRSSGVIAALVLAAVSTARPADADQVAACVRAYDQSQVLMRASKLLDARDMLLLCSDASCPEVVRTDCIQWAASVEQALPSVVLGATGPDGVDAISVRVWLDGREVAQSLDGRALPLDPGPHRFRFEIDGADPVERPLLVREGEKRRPVTVRFVARQTEAHERPVPALSYAAWAVGGLGFAGFAVLGIKGRTELEHLSDTCKPNCSKADEDAAWNKLIAADACGAIGLVATVIGTWLYVTRPERPASQQASFSSAALGVRSLPGGAMVGARIGF